MKQENKRNTSSPGKNNSFFIASLFIVAGVLLLGRNLGFFDFALFRTFFSWPVLLILIGIFLLIRRSFVGAFVLITIGGFFFLTGILGLSGVTVGQYWPLILVVIGLGLLLKRGNMPQEVIPEIPTEISDTAHSSKHTRHSENGYVETSNSFSSVEQVVMDPVFRGAKIRNDFGSTVLDLRHTRLEADTTFIDVNCSFGSIELLVPPQWYVRTELNQNLASFEDKRHLTGMYPDTAYCLVIRGNVMFSSLEVK